MLFCTLRRLNNENFEKDEAVIYRVVSDKNVEFEGKATTLSGTASTLLEKMGWQSPQVQGPKYWLYEGENLEARRKRVE